MTSENGLDVWESIPGMFEFSGLYDYVIHHLKKRKGPVNVIEVGVLLGRSTCYLAARAPENWMIHALDKFDLEGDVYHVSIPPNGHMVTAMANLRKLPLAKYNRVLFRKGDSIETAIEDRHIEGSEIYDMVCLDNDHSIQHVARELRVWWPLVKRGGFLCGDDFNLVQAPVFEFAEYVKKPLLIGNARWPWWLIQK
jgi:cephalosporin hydroxylase